MKIGSWRVIKDIPYGDVEWFNPASRMRINISKGDYSWHLYVHRNRKAPPQNGKGAPWFSRFFDTRELAVTYATELMNRENISFTDLNKIGRTNYDACVAVLKDILDKLMIQKAHMKKIGPNLYDWAGVIVKAYFQDTGQGMHSYFYYNFDVQGDKTREPLKIGLGPYNNEEASHYVGLIPYIWDRIDKPLKKMVMAQMTLNVMKEILSDWHHRHGRKNMEEPRFEDPEHYVDKMGKDIVWYARDIRESENMVRYFEQEYEDLVAGRHRPRPKDIPKKPLKSEDELTAAMNNLVIKTDSRMTMESTFLTQRIDLLDKLLSNPELKNIHDRIRAIRDYLYQLRTRIEVARDSFNDTFKKLHNFLELDRK